jgi:hypothetical protein
MAAEEQLWDVLVGQVQDRLGIAGWPRGGHWDDYGYQIVAEQAGRTSAASPQARAPQPITVTGL